MMRFLIGGDTRNRTEEWEFCRLVPYRLAMSPKYFRYSKRQVIHLPSTFVYGAGNEIRTRGICLGKAALYH